MNTASKSQEGPTLGLPPQSPTQLPQTHEYPLIWTQDSLTPSDPQAPPPSDSMAPAFPPSSGHLYCQTLSPPPPQTWALSTLSFQLLLQSAPLTLLAPPNTPGPFALDPMSSVPLDTCLLRFRSPCPSLHRPTYLRPLAPFALQLPIFSPISSRLQSPSFFF